MALPTTLGNAVMFQSLTWVERLSDPYSMWRMSTAALFQSLTWVERLSDSTVGGAPLCASRVSIPHLG